MSELQFESALAGVSAPEGLRIEIREIPDRGMIDLRGLASERKFMSAAKAALGVELPKTPRSVSTWGDIRVLWLSTDQWLALCPRAKTAGLVAALAKNLEGQHNLVTDVSDMRAVIRIEGEAARTTLLKGCSLDLLGGDYPAGTVRRLRFAEIAALLHVVEDTVFDLYVFRSYAHHAWNFLAEAGKTEVRVFGAQP